MTRNGQVVLIAGAVGETAFGIAEKFRGEGARVLVAAGASCPLSVSKQFVDYELIRGEPFEASGLDALKVRIVEKHGRLDLIINCTGSYSRQPEQRATVTGFVKRLRSLVSVLVRKSWAGRLTPSPSIATHPK
jgi:NAD(P)-dependent dehydrogenase (short-subunit alcohol dehydrogenase family)